MTRSERTVLAIACVAGGPFLSYLILSGVGSMGMGAIFFAPLLLLGPTAIGIYACVVVLRNGEPAAADPKPDGAASYRDAPPRTWDGDVAPKPPPRASGASLVAVPLIIVLVLLALGVCLPFCAGYPFGPG